MLWWAASAFGADLDTRITLYDGLLADAHGDTAAAAARFTQLSRNLAPDDRSLGDAQYWLGYTLYGVGRLEEAREALKAGIGTGACSRCRDLLELLEIDASSVSTVPASWSFDAGNPALFHPWHVQDLGSIRVAPGPDGDPALEWSTVARAGDPDRLVIGLRDPVPPPESLRFDVRSIDLDAAVEVRAEDVHGRLFSLPQPVRVPRGTAVRVVVPLEDLDPVDGTAPLDPREIVLLWIVDRTATRAAGPNKFWLDDVEIR